MHRSNFRPKKQGVRTAGHPAVSPEARPAVDDTSELELLREQIMNIGDRLLPLKATMETVAAQQRHDNKTIPDDLGHAVRAILERMERLEGRQAKTGEQFSKMETTFSNALLKMGDKVEKIAGGEDSQFSLAHSLEQLIEVLSNRKYRVVRDSDGNMVKLETQT